MEKTQEMASMLMQAIPEATLNPVEDQGIGFHRVPLLLGKQQIKVLPNWRVRQWLSLWLMGEHVPSLTVLHLGNLVMLGAPCDYSGLLTGPLYQEAREKNKFAFVTSFNGGYIGYITPDEYFDVERYETQTMNWYGPGNGSYIQACLNKMIVQNE